MVNDLKIKVSLSLEIGKSLSNKNCLVSTPLKSLIRLVLIQKVCEL